jgi:hypothetical protein
MPSGSRRRAPRVPVTIALGLVAVIALGGAVYATVLRDAPKTVETSVADRIVAVDATTPLTEATTETSAAPAETTAPPPTAAPKPAKDLAAPPTTSPTEKRLRAAERTASAFIVAIERGDCNALWGMFSAETVMYFERYKEDERPARESFCEGMTPDTSTKMTVKLPARSTGTDRAVVDIEAEGSTEPLAFVFENGGWKIDLLGATGPVEKPAPPDPATVAQRAIKNAFTAEQVYFTDRMKYTDDVDALRKIEPSLSWQWGIAIGSSPSGVVYVAQSDAGRVLCLTGRSSAGVLYMLKAQVDGVVTYASGSIPTTCDGTPLGKSW